MKLKNGKIHTEPAWCKGCGFCVALCPVKALELADGKVNIRENNSCFLCGQCEMHCPDYAIWLER